MDTETNSSNREEETIDQQPTQEVEEVIVDQESEAFKAAVSEKVEEVIKARLGRETEKLQKDLQEDFEKQLEALKKEKEALESEKAQTARTLLVQELALEENVSLNLIESLKGESKEDLLASLKLVRELSQKKEVKPVFTGKDFSQETKSISSMILSGMKK